MTLNNSRYGLGFCVVLALVLVVFALGCDTPRPTVSSEASIRPMTVGATPNVSAYGEAYIFSGQPDADSFAAFFEMGVRRVINLRSAEEMSRLDFDERELVTELGMRYVNIEVLQKGAEAEMIAAVMEEFAAASDGTTLVHCASSNRVGYAWSIYRGVRDGLSVDDAIAEGKLAGLKSGGLEARAREFIEDGVEQGTD